MSEIPSVPELRAARDSARVDFLLAYATGVRSYSLRARWERCEQALLDAEWWVACESWRWCHRPPFSFMSDDGGRVDWLGRRLVEAWKFSGVFSSPSRALVVRPKGEVTQ